MKTSKTSRATADLWDRANKRNAAQQGFPGSDPADAMGPYVPSFSVELAALNRDPKALDRLAARHDLTDAQRLKVLQTYTPKETPKATPKAKPPAPSRLSRTLAGVSLFGRSGTGARS